MSHDSIDKRERALEFGYFHEQETKLLRKLHERLDKDAHKQTLRENTPITDEALLDRLVDLGIHANTLNALSLIPLILVAWSDGGLHDAERDAVLSAAVEHGVQQGSEGWLLVKSWLATAPDRELLDVWKSYIGAIARELEPTPRRLLKEQLLAAARKVAKSAGGFLGVAPVSPGEKHILNEMEEAFE